MIGEIFDFLANLTGFARKRQDLANTPEMQAAAAARMDQATKDAARAAIGSKDLKKVRDLSAE